MAPDISSYGYADTVTITGDGTTVTYEPDEDYVGSDGFTYQISDGNGNTAIGYISVIVYEAGQWASSVITLSSNGDDSSQVLGAPDGESWTPTGSGMFEFITVGFTSAEYATGVLIRETSGGAIRKVVLIEAGGTAHTIWSGTDPTGLGYGAPVDFVLNFEETCYEVASVRIFVNAQSSYPSLDAVRLLTGGTATELTLNGRGFDYSGSYHDTTYDEDGLPSVVMTHQRGELIQIEENEYDGEGRLDARTMTDSLTHQTHFTFDDDGRVLTRSLAYDTLTPSTTTYVYNVSGQLISLTDPMENVTTWTYDAQGRETGMTDPLLEDENRTYDAKGRLATFIDRNDKLTTYAYDAQGRKITETWYDGPTDADDVLDTFFWTYNANGWIATAGNNLGTYTYQYDDWGRVIHVDEPFDVSLTFAYDFWGNRILVKDNKGGKEESTYDIFGHLVTRILTQGGTVLRMDQTFDQYGRVLTQTRYSNAVGTELVGTIEFTYDLNGRTTSIVQKDSEDEEIAMYSNTYDSEGRLIEKNDHGVITSYTYDAQGQLTDDGTNEYDYDLNGNREGDSEAGVGNRLETDGTWLYFYDFNGNMIKKTQGEEAETWTFGYNLRHQMIWAEKAATDGGAALMRADYGYDVYGNRILKSVWDGEDTTVQHFAYDGWNPAKPAPIGTENFDVWADLTEANALDVRYFRGDKVDEILGRVDGNGAAWLWTDYQGSVRDVTDDEGTVIARLDYASFGKVIYESEPELSGRYGYTARVRDLETGLQDNRGRPIDPDTGRFLTEDLLGLRPDVNPYRYVGNSPTNATDPSGLQEVALGKELMSRDSVKNSKDEERLKFLKLGEGFQWVDQPVKNKNVIVEVAKSAKNGKDFYVARYMFDIQFKNMVKGDDGLVQTLDLAETEVTAMFEPVPGAFSRKYIVEGFPFQNGIVIDPRGIQVSIFTDGKGDRVIQRVVSKAYVGTFNMKKVDKKSLLSEDKNDFTNVQPAPNTKEVYINIEFTLFKDGRWELLSKELGIEESGKYK